MHQSKAKVRIFKSISLMVMVMVAWICPHFDVSDFFEDPNGNISHLIGDGHVNSD